MPTIQKAVGGDAQEIQNVYYETWLQAYPNKDVGITREDVEKMFENAFTSEALEKRAEFLDNPPHNKFFLTAKDNDKIVGVCRCVIQEKYNKVESLYVLPEFQGEGIGKLLLNEAFKFFDVTNDIVVHVAVYNTQAIRFYEKFGFVDTGKRFTEERHRMPVSKVLIPQMEMKFLSVRG